MFQTDSPFFVGCNYWASHAGTAMWREWDRARVEEDLRLLAANGIEVVRIFPLWPDFQPLVRHTIYKQIFREMRRGEEAPERTEAGRAGVDPVMIERLGTVLDLAAEAGVRVIVGLLTGWMSGRMHVPRAFEGVNVLTDPGALRYEVRMVRYLVKTFRNHPAVSAWDLGNECNCCGQIDNPDEAWLWTCLISNAIRLEDAAHPVVSGMHTLQVGHVPGGRAWLIEDQGELTDVLTTHPYPIFTPNCNLEPVNTIRNAFHAATETRLYADLGGAPAFIEEAGTLGPSFAGETRVAGYVRNMLWNAYAHHCHGLLWWCAFHQDHLEQTPYDWCAMERELGMFSADGTPGAALRELSSFRRMLEENRVAALSEFRRNAVMILTPGQDRWTVAQAGFLLAKQANFDITFADGNGEIPESDFYILPSIAGNEGIPARNYRKLLARVRAGAVLLVTCDDGILQPFNEEFGVDVDYRARSGQEVHVRFADLDARVVPSCCIRLLNRRAEVLAEDDDHSPVFCTCNCGAGRLLYCTIPIELECGRRSGAFLPGADPWWRIYEAAAKEARIRRIVTRTDPSLTLTEHPAGTGAWLVAVNNTCAEISDHLTLPAGGRLEPVCGDGTLRGNEIRIAANSGLLLRWTPERDEIPAAAER